MTDTELTQTLENVMRALEDLQEKDPAKYLELLKKIEIEVDAMKEILG